MNVLVCGGRDYGDATRVHDVLFNQAQGMTMLIHGGASGADRLAGQWAAKNGIHTAQVNAMWDWFGRSAGPRRNEAMLGLQPDLVVAFPGGRGTAHMVGIAKAAGIRVIEVAA